MIQNKNFHWGQLIKEIREEKGLTKKELSELSGVPATTIGEIENVRNKNRGSNIHIIDKILIALGYELEAIAIDPEPSKFCSTKKMGLSSLRTHMEKDT
tara:strand:+ start:4315 stop:4611 length:297 start_codon:yes stop_codon:yes gene_type:complete